MKLFELVDTIDNDRYYVKVFESSYYNINVIRNKEFNYRRFEVSTNGDYRFIPKVYITSKITSDDDFEIGIQTTSYGSLKPDVFHHFVETQKKALEYVEEIKEIIENE